jgi:hypothetical protein
MPDAVAPIRYSRTQKLQGEIARAKGDIAFYRESTRHSRAGLVSKRLGDCTEIEMNLALEAMKRHPGATFQDCLAALRAK